MLERVGTADRACQVIEFELQRGRRRCFRHITTQHKNGCKIKEDLTRKGWGKDKESHLLLWNNDKNKDINITRPCL